MNIAIIKGNLTRDPELKFTQGGSSIANFSVAVNRKWKDPAGNEKEEVAFIEVTAFGKTAETIAQYFKKGRPILLEGRLKQDTWDDKQTGQKRSKLYVVLERFEFCGGDKAQAGSETPAKQKPDLTGMDGGAAPDENDDVPF